MKTLLMIAASGASAGLLVPTLAEARTFEANGHVSEAVSYNDLDIATAEGELRLKRRIAASLRRICGYPPSPRDLVVMVAARQCFEDGMESAQRQVRFAVAEARDRKASA